MNPKYIISKKHYEILKTFCSKYRIYKYNYQNYNLYGTSGGLKKVETRKSFMDPTANKAIVRHEIHEKIQIIENAARTASPDLYDYILLNVTDNYTYHWMRGKMGLKCSWTEFADLRAKFFWLLDKTYFSLDSCSECEE